LQKANGGRGVLLGGVPGVGPGKVTIIGGGVAGTNAAEMAVGLGAEVTILDRSVPRLRQISEIYGGRVKTEYSTKHAIDVHVPNADLVVGAVLIAGATAPKLVTAEHVKQMRAGAVLVDISIDQGGCFETSRPTTHAEPTYLVDDVVHYCVTNMPGYTRFNEQFHYLFNSYWNRITGNRLLLPTVARSFSVMSGSGPRRRIHPTPASSRLRVHSVNTMASSCVIR